MSKRKRGAREAQPEPARPGLTSHQPKKSKSEAKTADTPLGRLKKMLDAFLKSEEELKFSLKASWLALRGKHARIAYNPESNCTLEFKEETGAGKETPHGPRLAIDFLPLEIKQGSGSAAPSIKDILISKLKEKNLVVERDEGGEAKVLCPGELKLVDARHTQRDHLQPKKELIREQLPALIKQVGPAGIEQLIVEDERYKPLFISAQFSDDSEEKYYGTKLLYELAATYLDNLWLLCCICNHSKSDQDVLDWFQPQEQFGDDFLSSLSQDKVIAGDQVLQPEQLVDKALDWLTRTQGQYIELLKRISQDVEMPLGSAAADVRATRDAGKKAPEAEKLGKTITVASALVSSPGRRATVKEFEKHSPDTQQRAREQLEQNAGPLIAGAVGNLLAEAEKLKKEDSAAVSIQNRFERQIHRPFAKNQKALSHLELQERQEAKAMQLASTLEAQTDLAAKIFSDESFSRLQRLTGSQRAVLTQAWGEKFQEFLDSQIQQSYTTQDEGSSSSSSSNAEGNKGKTLS